jgi:DNA-directed RNA polymerase subunit N (RpoN/RPB10)
MKMVRGGVAVGCGARFLGGVLVGGEGRKERLFIAIVYCISYSLNVLNGFEEGILAKIHFSVEILDPLGVEIYCVNRI